MRPSFAHSINTAWRLRSTPARRRFERALADPRAAQERVLAATLASCRHSLFAAEHGLSGAVSIEDWRRRVPVRAWHEFAPWMTQIERGVTNVLSDLPVSRLVPTSGSTQARKLVPYNALLMSQLRESLDAWIGDLFRHQPKLMTGPAYWGVSPAIAPLPSDTRMAVPVGFDDDSEYVGGRLAPLLEKVLAVPSAVREIQDTESFRYVTLLFLLESPALTLISIWHPSFLELLLDALPRFFDSLVRDLFDGTVKPQAGLEPSLARRLRRGRPPSRDRKQRARTLESCGPHDLQALWPKLQMVSCWTDGSAALPATTLANRLGSIPVAAKGLLATEAFVSIPVGPEPSPSSRPAAVTGHLLEFEDQQGKAHFCWELEAGQRYTVVVTTGSGLQRYRLGDIVEVTGFQKQTPSLEFIARSQASDLCGEKLSEEFVAMVLPALLYRFAAAGQQAETPTFALLAPESHAGQPPCYSLFLEASHADVTDGDAKGWSTRAIELALELDQEFSANPHWELARRLGQLGAPRVFRVEPETGRTSYEARLAAEGMRLGDIKPALLSTRSEWSTFFEGSWVTP